MEELCVLRISGDESVDLNGVKLCSTTEVAEALEKMDAANPKLTVSIEANGSISYEAMGKAIYGSHRAAFSGERLRILVDGKLSEA
jgi:biopolymer transport protein ExbD